MRFDDMKPAMWLRHRNGVRATVIDIDKELNPAFRVVWQTGQTNWYAAEIAEDFTPVALKVG